MPEYSGSALVIAFIGSAGTATLTGDQRAVSLKPNIKTIVATAGSDAFETYLMGVQDTTINGVAVHQTGGTAMEDALASGIFGTLTVSPEGTATGKRKYTVPAFSLGASFDWKYNDIVEIQFSFQGSGTPTRGVY